MRIQTVLLQITTLLPTFSMAEQAASSGDARTGLEPPPGPQIKKELAPRLSEAAAIFLPASPEWNELVVRASTPRVAPSFIVSVQPATEQDVQEIVSDRASPARPRMRTDSSRSNTRIASTSPSLRWQEPMGGLPRSMTCVAASRSICAE
jgi:hypothetical protein